MAISNIVKEFSVEQNEKGSFFLVDSLDLIDVKT